MNTTCRDRYKAKFEAYLEEFLPSIGRKESQAHQMAIDTFFLERNDEHDFMYWFSSDEAFYEAENRLSELFRNRKSYKKSLKDHIDYMTWFKAFLSEESHK